MYSFPPLSNAEILQCMDELKISMTEADILKPTSSRVAKLYEGFAEIMTGATRAEFEQPNFEVMELLENPEIHLSALAEMGLFRTLLRMFKAVGVSDFSMRDLLKPEPPRVRKLLSALINFAKFREEHLPLYEKFTKLTDELNEKKQTLETKNQTLAEKVGKLRVVRAQEEPALRDLAEQNENLSAEVNKFGKEQAKFKAENQALKTQCTEIADKISEKTLLVINARQDSNRLRGQIVESPEKLTQALADLNASLANEKENLTSNERRARELLSKLEGLTGVEQDLEKIKALMLDCEAEMAKHEEVMGCLTADQDALVCRQTEMKELGLREQQLQRQGALMQEKLHRLVSQQALKRDAAKQKMESLRKEHQDILSERASVQAKVLETERVIKDFQNKITEVRRHHEEEMETIKADFEALRVQVQSYHGEIRHALLV